MFYGENLPEVYISGGGVPRAALIPVEGFSGRDDTIEYVISCVHYLLVSGSILRRTFEENVTGSD